MKYGMVQPGKTVQEKFALLLDCGFDGVELDSPSNLARDEVLAAKEKTGLAIPGVVDSVHWDKPLSDADPAVRAVGRKALETALRDAAAYGCTSVLLVPAVVKKDVSYQQAWERSQNEIKTMLPLAAELRIRILIENVWNKFLLGPTELARYVDELQSEWVGVHFDAGNLVTFGFPEQEAAPPAAEAAEVAGAAAGCVPGRLSVLTRHRRCRGQRSRTHHGEDPGGGRSAGGDDGVRRT